MFKYERCELKFSIIFNNKSCRIRIYATFEICGNNKINLNGYKVVNMSMREYQNYMIENFDAKISSYNNILFPNKYKALEAINWIQSIMLMNRLNPRKN